MQLLETNPFGLVISARNRVREVTSFVKCKIQRFHKKLGALKAAVNKTIRRHRQLCHPCGAFDAQWFQ